MATQNAIYTSDPIEVSKGGTGASTVTAYAVTCGGTTATGPIQSVASVGTGDQLLTSNGAGALPTFQNKKDGSLILIETQTASSSASLDFTTSITATYSNYLVLVENLLSATDATLLYMKLSTDGGSSWIGTSGYYSGVNNNAIQSTTRVNNNINNGAQFAVTPTLDTSVGPGACLKLWLLNITTGEKPMMTGQGVIFRSSDNLLCYEKVTGYYNGDITVDGIQFLMSSGNIASGSVSLYGVSK